MTDTTHTCPAEGCDEVVPFDVLACKKHWFELPPQLRKGISRAWSSGNLTRWAELRAAAVAFLSIKPVDIREPKVR